MQSLKGLSKGSIATDKDIRIATRLVKMHDYKYSRGRVLIIVGSAEWRGAAVMAAYAANNSLAALRTVSGFVTVAAQKERFPLLSRFSPVFVLKEFGGSVKYKVDTVDSIRHDATIIGPSIQDSNLGLDLLEKIVISEHKKGKPVIIDAGVIGIISRKKSMIKNNMILTPHDGEFKTLTRMDLKGKSLDVRARVAKEFATKYGCVLVLKGHETIITDGKRLKINIAKSPALATMGSGDVLCGIVASYAAQHHDNFESAVAAVHLHSIIGDALFKKKGMHVIATDIIEAIPGILKRFDVVKP